MNSEFWAKLEKPFFVLAPMADVTDAAFRRVIAKYGKPDVMWTEFVSADGLAHPAAREKLSRDLVFTEAERPIVAQLFGSNPEKMKEAVEYCASLGFDGIDINMGCPDRTIEKQGAGAAAMKSPEQAKKVILAAREGAGLLPVSIKTRIGYNKIDLSWIGFILSLELPALTVHLRTRKEMSKVPAHWEIMPEIVALRDKVSPNTLIIGNGDINTIEEAKKKIDETGADGIMIGRGIFGNPFLFVKQKRPESSDEGQEIRNRLEVMVEHTKLFEELLGDIKSFSIMKKHYKAYVTGWDGSKELRMKLMEVNSATEVATIVDEYLLHDIVGKRKYS